MPSSLPPRYVVCDNPTCVYAGQLRQVHPIRIGIDLFTYPPAYCGCDGRVELRVSQAPTEAESVPAIHDAVEVPTLCGAGKQLPGRLLNVDELVALEPGDKFFIDDIPVTVVSKMKTRLAGEDAVFRIVGEFDGLPIVVG